LGGPVPIATPFIAGLEFFQGSGTASVCRIFVGFGAAAFSLSIGVIKKRLQTEVGAE
jgi:hypothetical protein